MDRAQVGELYMAFAVGYFQNNYIKPKWTDVETYVTKLKRLFRSYCNDSYGEDPTLLEEVKVDDWKDWTIAALGRFEQTPL